MEVNTAYCLRRTKLRFGLKAWFAAVGILALALAALRVPSTLVASICYSLAWTLVVAAVVLAINRTGIVRTYCIAFAIGCGVHLYLSFVTRGEQLLVTHELFFLAEPLFPQHDVRYTPPPPIGQTGEPTTSAVYYTEDAQVVWQSLWSIGLGHLTGLIAIYMQRRRSEVERRSPA